jgi:hypothetical protein
VNEARLLAQRHLLRYGEPAPVETVVQLLADYKHVYTQTGGLRPFGVSLMYAGWDSHRGFQLYLSDPSGNYAGWRACAMGANSGNATASLKDDYEEGLSVTQALDLAVTTLLKALDTTSPSADRVDVTVLTLNGGLGAGPEGKVESTGVSKEVKDAAASLGDAAGLADITAPAPVHRVLEESEVADIIERVRDKLVKDAESSSSSSSAGD